jgi:hypothetical protein
MNSTEMLRRSTPLDLNQLEADVTAILPSMRPPAFQLQPMPDYVAHQEGVSRVGALSAEAVVRDYETAAKEIEAMGAELISAAKKCEAMTAQVNSAIAYMQETAKAYREEAKKIFQRIEDCSMLTEDVRKTCEALRQKIESNNTA